MKKIKPEGSKPDLTLGKRILAAGKNENLLNIFVGTPSLKVGFESDTTIKSLDKCIKQHVSCRYRREGVSYAGSSEVLSTVKN